METSFSLDEDNIAEKLRVETFGKTIEILILNEVKYYSQKLLTSITNNGKIIYTGSSNTDIIKIFGNRICVFSSEKINKKIIKNLLTSNI